MLFLLFGCYGIYLSQQEFCGPVMSVFNFAAFLVAFLGCCLAFAFEWSNLFVLSAVAYHAPDSFEPMGKSVLMTAGFLSSLGVCILGWILQPIVVIIANGVPRWTAILTLGGIFSTFILIAISVSLTGSTLPGIIVGNLIFSRRLDYHGLGYRQESLLA